MHIVYLDKKITLENIINEINLINIDEDIKYLNRNDGILIKGFVNIECEYLSLGVIKHFMDKVDVALLIPYENIITNELQFKLLDFDYVINNNKLLLSFKINIEGYKEIEKSFQNETQEMEIVSNVDVSLSEIKEIIKDKDDIIEIDNLSSIINNPTDEIEMNILEENNNEINTSISDEKLDEPLNEGKRLKFNINGENDSINDTITSIETKKSSLFDSIFKKDKRIKMWKYRVILENDNYEEIAKEYNVNLYKLKEINQNTSLETGKIIKIPSYHE